MSQGSKDTDKDTDKVTDTGTDKDTDKVIVTDTDKVTDTVTEERVVVAKKTLVIFTYKQRHLSIDMKTKVVQHVPRINISI